MAASFRTYLLEELTLKLGSFVPCGYLLGVGILNVIQEKNIIVPSGLPVAVCSDSVSKTGYALLTTHQEDTCFELILQAAGRFAVLHLIAGTLLGSDSAPTTASFRVYLC